MRLSDRGIELIAQFEGFVAHPYDDAAGHATIGFGHLLHHGPVTRADVARWGSIPRGRGLEILRADARAAERAVESAVEVPLRQQQFDALVCFAFNVGGGAFAASTLVRKLNAGDDRGAADELMRWTKAGGRVLEGLVRRRAAERALMLTPPAVPPAGLTPAERAWITEYDALERDGRDPGRRATLRARMRRRLDEILAAARGAGWDDKDRRLRYRTLLTRAR